jgi:transposase
MLQLKPGDKEKIKHILKKGDSARKISRAHVINLRCKGYTVIEVSDVLEITPRTVINVTNNYEEGGLAKAIEDDPRPGQPPKFDDRIKAKIVATVCSEPPEGFDRWTLELLQERAVEENIVEGISKETIRLILREHDIKPWQYKMWCVPKLNKEYIERMEKILDLYQKDYDASHPVICIDEKPVPLTGDVREIIPCRPGAPKKVDYEYSRHGSANVFCAVEPKTGIYINQVTEQKSAMDFAKFIGKVERRYKDVEKINLVIDNYCTHFGKALSRFYGEMRGEGIWDRFDVYYTPKHGSWLNQAEIAIGMYDRQCLGTSRTGDINSLRKKTRAWNKIINRKGVKIQWKFTKENAREKMEYG